MAKYDKNFEILSTSKEDKSMFWLGAILLALLSGCAVIYVVSWVFSLLILLCSEAVKRILEKVEEHKAKSQKQ